MMEGSSRFRTGGDCRLRILYSERMGDENCWHCAGSNRCPCLFCGGGTCGFCAGRKVQAEFAEFLAGLEERRHVEIDPRDFRYWINIPAHDGNPRRRVFMPLEMW